MDNVNWDSFKAEVASKLEDKSPEDYSIDELASVVSSALFAAGEKCVGRKCPGSQKRSVFLPRTLVDELDLKRKFERKWKTQVADGKTPPDQLIASEKAFIQQKKRVNDFFKTGLLSDILYKVLATCGKCHTISKYKIMFALSNFIQIP